MGTRFELHEILCDKLGSRNVYFQPPESIRMNYPAIVYELSRIRNDNANDKKYLMHRHYMVKYISRDPDNAVIDDLLQLDYCAFDRRFIAENLYHDCFDLYY